ncbi:Uncharacterised protein [Bordetella pertussis]|nr:Uncharacterised protein [Bordetella pertussis]
MMMAATRRGSTSVLNRVPRAASASSVDTPCSAFGYGTW